MTDNTYRTVTPYLVVNDADAELRFLEAAFSAEIRDCTRTPDGRVAHAEVTIGDSLVMLGQCGPESAAPSPAIYLWVDDVDATWAQALAAGATEESKPQDMPYGHRNGGVIDPNGNTWWIGSPVRTVS